MTRVSITVDSKAVKKALDDHVDQWQFATTQAINNMAFGVRDEWPKIATRQIDRPVAFTKNKKALLIRKATKKDRVAVVELKHLQADYLEAGIEGERRDLKRSEERGNIPRAVPARDLKLDKNGNMRLPGTSGGSNRAGGSNRGIKYGAVINEALADAKPGHTGKFFIVSFAEATPNRPAGIWQRLKGKRKRKPKGKYQRNRFGQPKRIGKPKKARPTWRARPIFIFVKGQKYKPSIKFHEPILNELEKLAPGAMDKAIAFAIKTAR